MPAALNGVIPKNLLGYYSIPTAPLSATFSLGLKLDTLRRLKPSASNALGHLGVISL